MLSAPMSLEGFCSRLPAASHQAAAAMSLPPAVNWSHLHKNLGATQRPSPSLHHSSAHSLPPTPTPAVFAPDTQGFNAAVASGALSKDQLASRDFLRGLILDSIVPEALTEQQLRSRASVTTAGGRVLPVSVQGGGWSRAVWVMLMFV